MFQEWFKGKGDSRAIKKVSIAFQASFKDCSRVYQGCFKDISECFEGLYGTKIWGSHVMHFKHRDSPYLVHFKYRDSPYVILFKCGYFPWDVDFTWTESLHLVLPNDLIIRLLWTRMNLVIENPFRFLGNLVYWSNFIWKMCQTLLDIWRRNIFYRRTNFALRK